MCKSNVIFKTMHILSTPQAYRIKRFHSNGDSLLQEIDHFIKTNITLHVRGKERERWKLVVGALCSRGTEED